MIEFIIQENLINEGDLDKIKLALTTIPVKYVKLIPFTTEILSDSIIDGVDYIPYGSTSLTNIAYSKAWRGLHFDPKTFNYMAAIKNRNDMLNDEHIISVKDALVLLKSMNPSAYCFIRPSEDLKQFSGQVINVQECIDWLLNAMMVDSSITNRINENMMVVIAAPKEIIAEWRWFIIGGKVIDGSLYRHHGILVKEHENDPAIIKEAQKFADKWIPDKCCVMDTALDETGELKVIEFNTINSTGFYDNDINKIFTKWYDYWGNR